jgi:hypothetical protein
MGNELARVTAAEIEKQWRAMNAALERLGKVEARGEKMGTQPARLLFGIDLTASREWSLAAARRATAAMFDAVAALGPVAVKLAYFRGEECKAGPWRDDPGAVCRSMLALSCKAGGTMIGDILRMAENEPGPLAVVLIGDTCEEEADELVTLARRLGRKRIPVYVFHERSSGGLFMAREILEAIADESGGVYCPFGAGSAEAVRELLAGVAAFSAAGVEGVKRVGLPVTVEGQELRARLLLPAGK